MTSRDARRDRAMRLVAGGLSLRAEVVEVIARQDGTDIHNGALGRAVTSLVTDGLMDVTIVRLFGRGSLHVLRLSDAGRAWCELRGVRVERSEWDTLRERHAGETYVRHAAACLALAYHARRRGWRVVMMPWVRWRWQPDALVLRQGERVYVEVEMRARRERVEAGKWANALVCAGYERAKLGICALRPYAVERFTGWVPGALVTDLQSLFRGQAGLWQER